jgi:hypothetical protein
LEQSRATCCNGGNALRLTHHPDRDHRAAASRKRPLTPKVSANPPPNSILAQWAVRLCYHSVGLPLGL